MSYSPIQRGIWNDPKFQKYDSNTKLVFIYLISHKTNITGIYEVTIDDIAHYTKVPLPNVVDILENSFHEDTLEYDFDISTVYVKNHFKHNKSVSGNPQVVHASISKNIRESFSAKDFWNHFYSTHEDYLNELREKALNSPTAKKKKITINPIKDCLPSSEVSGKKEQTPLVNKEKIQAVG